MGVTLLSAGCTSTRFPGRGDDCAAGFHVSGDRFDPAADLVKRLEREERAVVAEAIETGGVERTTYGGELLRDGVFVERSGTFYRTAVSTAGTESVTAYSLNLEWERGQKAPEDATVVKFGDLPKADREALQQAVYGGEERERHPEESLGITDFPAPYPEGIESSRLAEGVTWVRWNDRTYRVELGGARTQERRTVRYEVEQVATASDEFREVVASEYRIELSDLPDESRSVVSKALEDGYEECSPASDALRTLRKRLPDDRRLPFPGDGWYVRFDGGDYQLSIRQWER